MCAKLVTYARRHLLKMTVTWFVLASAIICSCAVCADEISVQTNVYNVHYHDDPDHIPFSPLIGAEFRKSNGWLFGGALFRNSFGQFSQVIYGGYLYNFGTSPFYGKVVGGIVHGYTGAYKDKLPMNVGGFAPGIFPALGCRIGPVRIESQFFWTNGLMVTMGIAF
ncbi:sn-glycerol-3-phosphate transporter [Paraburkholderia bengalensis]|uniref:Sn-glycerol-3-phosphate transporter n=1 Tax=Paraburkholderia bengalensis TaxID=2747562 RepID=A0ABU8J264_9BURK